MIGWTSPWLLWGMAAATVPVLIHLLTRPRPVVIPFPALSLLHHAGRGKQRLNVLRTLLLLLLRTTAVLALALAFTKPYWKAYEAAPEPGKATRVVLVVDHSMSMSATRLGIPLFSQATADAADLLRNLEDGSEAAIVFSGVQPLLPLPSLSPNRPLLHTKLAQAKPTFEKGNPLRSLAAAKALLGGAGSIHVFSDFQRSEWANINMSEMDGIPIYLHPSSHNDIDNTAITSITLHPANPLPGETTTLHATIQHFAPTNEAKTVILEMDNIALHEQVTLEAFSSATVAFQFTMPHTGVFAGEVRMESDALTADDRRFFRIRVPEAMNILLVSDASPGSGKPGDFLACALAPAGDATQGIELTRRSATRLDRESLEKASVIIIDGTANIPEDTIPGILALAATGTPVFSFLDGPRSLAFLQALQSAKPQPLALPFMPGGVQTHTEMLAIDPNSAQTNLLRQLTLESAESMRTLSARPLSTQDTAGAEAHIHLRYADGTIAIATSPFGTGTITFINCPLSPERGTIAGHPLFPILLHELLMHTRNQDDTMAYEPGVERQLFLPQNGYAADDAAWTLRSGTEHTPLLTHTEGNMLMCTAPAATIPGAEELMHGSKQIDFVITNPDSQESLTRQADLAYLTENTRGKVHVSTPTSGGAVAGQPRALWHLFTLAACVALLMEMLLLLCWPPANGKQRRLS